MRKKGMILAALSLLLMFPFTGAWAFSKTWNFTHGLDTTAFMFWQNDSFTLNDSGGNLLISKDSTGAPVSPQIGFNAGVNSQFSVQGNFDIRVDYNLVSTLNSNDGIQLGIGDMAGASLQLWRDNVPIAGNNYYVSAGQSSGWLGKISTEDTAATLRLQRTGSSVAASVIHDGSETSIYTFDFGNSDVYFYMGLVQTQTSDFGSMSASFDTLSVTADNIVPLPPSVLLLGSGLLGLAGWGYRRRKL